jgi:hypothetical protein
VSEHITRLSRDKGDVNGQLQRRRERNADVEEVTGFKATRSSSGVGKGMASLRRRTWEDVEPFADHGGDFVAYMGDARITPSRAMVVSLTVPRAYGLDLHEALDASAGCFVMVRLYYVPRAPFQPEEDDDGEDTETHVG